MCSLCQFFLFFFAIRGTHKQTITPLQNSNFLLYVITTRCKKGVEGDGERERGDQTAAVENLCQCINVPPNLARRKCHITLNAFSICIWCERKWDVTVYVPHSAHSIAYASTKFSNLNCWKEEEREKIYYKQINKHKNALCIIANGWMRSYKFAFANPIELFLNPLSPFPGLSFLYSVFFLPHLHFMIWN